MVYAINKETLFYMTAVLAIVYSISTMAVLYVVFNTENIERTANLKRLFVLGIMAVYFIEVALYLR
jgi:hypothetical protein